MFGQQKIILQERSEIRIGFPRLKHVVIIRNILIGFISFVVMNGCNSEPEKKLNLYFNLEKYFEEQITQLDSVKPEVQKIVTSDGKSETKSSRAIIWRNELKPFLEVDLNKPVFQNKFLVDTILGEESYSVVYTAIDSTIPVQFAMVDFDDKQRVSQIRLKVISKNKIYSSEQSLSYQAFKGYSVELEEDIFPQKKRSYSLFARFFK